ncbi:histidine phosphatase family protein [Streptomyces sp. DASNCL29]|uniref:histidine phosphatase family protein n=1 Tax=Streptomyces sp. DASNCL29 TaxID=2583819 RepID=UPI00110F6F17|nr:histidine phosphatase family protein [Streptomyces sp. DASNCL29]TMU94935.1 histidine phosphatase family protein [Streptomyces sp. DASNCL29]
MTATHTPHATHPTDTPHAATRYLYLTRHGEATPDEGTLTPTGRRQATLLGERLRGVPLSAIHHGPLPRAAETARLIGDQLDGVPAHACEPAGDYVPYTPRRDELPADSADFLLEFVHRFPPEERARGPLLARAAEERFTGPVDGPEDRHELVVTHNFLIGWLVRAVLDAPKWRWLGLNQCNAALTVIRCPPPGRPPSVLFSNDMAHLPAPLRWTGYPPELRITY